MSDENFEARANAALGQLLERLEADEDLDVEEKADGVIEIAFDDGSKIIINRHSAAQEIWVAARSGGFHFRYQDGSWRNTRDGSELLSSVAALVAARR